MYKILDYTYKRAADLGVQVVPSNKKRYKIDVYKDGVFINSIGQKGALDYPNYIELERAGRFKSGYANMRRQLYYNRHPHNYGYLSKDYLSKVLLW
jgi:hypothetical protein